MARGGGIALKGVSLFLRWIEFCCAAIILGIFSWFLWDLHHNSLPVATYIRAVEGISGSAVLYTVFGLLLVCFLGGIAFLSAIAMLLDLAFTGAFIYVAWALRGGASSCSGVVNTPLGSGNTSTNNRLSDGGNGYLTAHASTVCRLETATFAVAIVAAVFFFLSIFVELALIRHHKKEKAFGPSPNNGYTAGSPRRKFWQRKSKRDVELAGGMKADALPAHQTPADFRTSYATDATAVGQEPAVSKYSHNNMSGAGVAQEPVHSMYGNNNLGGAGAVPQSVGTAHHGYQTQTTTNTGGYTPYRNSNGTF